MMFQFIEHTTAAVFPDVEFALQIWLLGGFSIAAATHSHHTLVTADRGTASRYKQIPCSAIFSMYRCRFELLQIRTEQLHHCCHTLCSRLLTD
jgi:hypothetical protein